MTGIGKIGAVWRAFFRNIHLGDFETKKAAIEAVKDAQFDAGLYVKGRK